MSTEYALKINEKRFVGLVSIIFSECYILYEYNFIDPNVIER